MTLKLTYRGLGIETENMSKPRISYKINVPLFLRF